VSNSTAAAFRTVREVLSQLTNALTDEECGRLPQRMDVVREILRTPDPIKYDLLRVILKDPIAFNFFRKSLLGDLGWEWLDNIGWTKRPFDDVSRQILISEHLGETVTEKQLHLFLIVLDRIGRRTRALLEKIGFVIEIMPITISIHVDAVWKDRLREKGVVQLYPPSLIKSTSTVTTVKLVTGVYLVPIVGSHTQRMLSDKIRKDEVPALLERFQDILLSLGCACSVTLPNIWEMMAIRLLSDHPNYPREQWHFTRNWSPAWIRGTGGRIIPLCSDDKSERREVMPLLCLCAFDDKSRHNPGSHHEEYEYLRLNNLLPKLT